MNVGPDAILSLRSNCVIETILKSWRYYHVIENENVSVVTTKRSHVAVAPAFGIGTTIGWKRVVVTFFEKIGKTHLNYAQGASAELVAMTTIATADIFGSPVSTA